MIKATSTILLTFSCAALAACSSIGTINGVDMNGRMGATSDGPQPYCTQSATQQWVCILAGATIVGAAAAVIATAHHNTESTPQNNAPTSSPASPPR